MHSQIQCPVCTLYLHVGMNLYVHLDTHPKDQVIRALVNMTVVQNSPEDEPVNQMKCSRYAPLNDEALTPQTESQQQQQQQPTIATIETVSTVVVAPRPAEPSVPMQSTSFLTPTIAKITTLSQPTLTPPLTPSSCQLLPPPPPYGEYSKLCAIVRSDSNTEGISSHARNHILQETITSHVSREPIVVESDVNSVYLDDDRDEFYPEEETDEYCSERTFIISDVTYVPQENPLEGYEDHYTDDTPDPYEYSQTEEAVHEAAETDQSLTARPIDSIAGRIVERRGSNGLHVLSDVTLTTDLSITSIINVKRSNDRQSGMIKLSNILNEEPSTINHVLPRQNQSDEQEIAIIDETSKTKSDESADNLESVETMCQALTIDVTAEEDDDDVEIIEPESLTTKTTDRNIIIVKCESLSPNPTPTSGTTSVIRMASSPLKYQKILPKVLEETNVQPGTSESPPNSKSQSKAFVKQPFTKPPKKLVVKFKKPFVPVIEEEANLQPPDRPMEVDEPKEEIRAATPALDPAEELIATFDTHPFSPFRQSFTPVPLITFNDDDVNDAFVNCNVFTKPEAKSKKSNMQIKNESVDVISQELENAVVPIDGQCEDDSKDFVLIDIDDTELTPDDDKHDIFFQSDCQPESSSTSFASTSNNSSYVSIATTSASASSSSSSGCSTTSNTAREGPSNRSDYDLCLMLGYNNPSVPTNPTGLPTPITPCTDAFSTPNHINEYGWTQRFSPQYVPFETDKSTYTNLDECKTISRNSTGSSSFNRSGGATATTSSSSDSLNIRTDEQMPAKGEISEQESNGDLDGSWSLHVYPLQDTLPRYTSSYDTTVARESWSLGNGPSGSQAAEINHNNRCITPSDSMQMMLPKFTAIEATFNNDEFDQKPDIKPKNLDVFLLQPQCQPGASGQPEATQPKVRRFRCTVCPLVFFSLKTKRLHLSEVHQINPPVRRVKATATITSSSSSVTANDPVQISTVSSLPSTAATSLPTSEPNTLEDIKVDVKDVFDTAPPPIVTAEATTTLSRHRTTSRLKFYLLNYNWTVLRDRILQNNMDDPTVDIKLPSLPTDTNTYMCMVCHAVFNSVRRFDEHMSIHPAECYTCGREFRHWYNLSIHLKRHLNIRDHQCKQCPKNFSSRTNLIEHMTMHSTEARLQCKICLRRFRRQSNLILHRKRAHFNIKPRRKDFICWCGEVFHTKAKIAWHRETHDKSPKCCPHCRERFIHRNSLSRHIRISHTDHFVPGSGTEMVKCGVCSKKFLKTSLKLHMITHDPNPETNGAIEFACTICNKSFTTKWNLKQHKWVHASRSTKPFRCTFCPKAFIREADYTTHVNTHKSIKPYTCDHCGLQFARKYNWLRHAREHENAKKFKCDDCGKIFHRAYYLKEHKRTHTGERPFECVICGKTSTTKTNHNKHIRIHHARDPMPSET